LRFGVRLAKIPPILAVLGGGINCVLHPVRNGNAGGNGADLADFYLTLVLMLSSMTA